MDAAISRELELEVNRDFLMKTTKSSFCGNLCFPNVCKK